MIITILAKTYAPIMTGLGSAVMLVADVSPAPIDSMPISKDTAFTFGFVVVLISLAVYLTNIKKTLEAGLEVQAVQLGHLKKKIDEMSDANDERLSKIEERQEELVVDLMVRRGGE